jgi:hypothetical protein
MPNPNGAKGSAFERDSRRFLEQVFGRAVRRPHAEGFRDVGDLHLSPFVIQAKNWKDTTAALNDGVKGAEIQAVHAGEPYGVAVIKKRQAPISEARIAMTFRTFRRLVARLLRAEDLLRRHAPDAYASHTQQIKDDA